MAFRTSTSAKLVAKLIRRGRLGILRHAGWSREEVEQQVLTPIEESSLLGTAHPDPKSIICYQIPGSLPKDGKPIIGGLDIDIRLCIRGKIYPSLMARVPQIPTRNRHLKERSRAGVLLFERFDRRD